MMALLGPAPAALFGMLAMAVDGRVNRGPLPGTLLNVVIFGLLGLLGGLLMQAFGLARTGSSARTARTRCSCSRSTWC